MTTQDVIIRALGVFSLVSVSIICFKLASNPDDIPMLILLGVASLANGLCISGWK